MKIKFHHIEKATEGLKVEDIKLLADMHKNDYLNELYNKTLSAKIVRRL